MRNADDAAAAISGCKRLSKLAIVGIAPPLCYDLMLHMMEIIKSYLLDFLVHEGDVWRAI